MSVRDLQPEIYHVKTSDDWNLALYRYRGRSSKKFPILAIHGIGTNRYSLDFVEPRLSIAKQLHAVGYDVWVMELRGTGGSAKQGPLAYFANWNFDDYVFKDLPAVVSFIQKATGQKRLHWLGNSLGGTVAYAAIETLGNDVCQSLIIVGSSMSAEAKPGFVKLLLAFDCVLKHLVVTLPNKLFARAAAPFLKYIVPFEDNFYFCLDNIEKTTLALACQYCVENSPPALVLQLHDWYKHNHFRSVDHRFSYRDHLKKITAPTLILAGSTDGLTPVHDCRYAYDKIRSRDKKFVTFGRDYGCKAEYSHADLLLGRYAPQEVYPVIRQWLAKH
ncbi:MAG: alpha/beta fold hydrolase [Deltaproteobacteria bacterium]|nr:alpha/beta fold hydrolase [Deltaproteobacteria bacterium]